MSKPKKPKVKSVKAWGLLNERTNALLVIATSHKCNPMSGMKNIRVLITPPPRGSKKK